MDVSSFLYFLIKNKKYYFNLIFNFRKSYTFVNYSNSQISISQYLLRSTILLFLHKILLLGNANRDIIHHDIIYRIRRCLVTPKRLKLPQIHEEGLDNGDFLFFFNFLKFYIFCVGDAAGGCLIITSSYLYKKNKNKIRRI